MTVNAHQQAGAIPVGCEFVVVRLAAVIVTTSSSITLAALRDQREAVSELAWLRFHCNRIAGREGAWLPPGAWQACQRDETQFEPGERIWIGADLGGGERSTSAVVYLNERLHVGCEIFPGESSAINAAEFIAELAETYTVVEAAYDPWQGALLAETMTQRGLVAVQFRSRTHVCSQRRSAFTVLLPNAASSTTATPS